MKAYVIPFEQLAMRDVEIYARMAKHLPVSVNLSVTQPTGAGNLRLYPAGSSLPLVSSINYAAGQTRANSAIVPLSALGAITVRCAQAAGTTLQPGCHPPGHESSVSSAWASTPFARAASMGPHSIVSPTTVATALPP